MDVRSEDTGRTRNSSFVKGYFSFKTNAFQKPGTINTLENVRSGVDPRVKLEKKLNSYFESKELSLLSVNWFIRVSLFILDRSNYSLRFDDILVKSREASSLVNEEILNGLLRILCQEGLIQILTGEGFDEEIMILLAPQLIDIVKIWES